MLKFRLRGKTEFLIGLIKGIEPTDGTQIQWRQLKTTLIKKLRTDHSVAKVKIAKEYLEVVFTDGKTVAWKWAAISWFWCFAKFLSP